MEKIDKKTQEKIQELQMIEQTLQNVLYQSQTFQIEFNEAKSALEEVKKTNKDVYRIVGNIMISSKKEDIEKELEEKNKILDLRIKSLEKQEKMLRDKLDNLRKDLEKNLKSE
jgi:prefoldin beta subunit